MPKAPPRISAKISNPDRTAWRTSTKNTTERGYGWQHQKARDRLLKQEPLCRSCKAAGRTEIATIADHIVPLAVTGRRAPSELQPLCAACHRKKTLSEALNGRDRPL